MSLDALKDLQRIFSEQLTVREIAEPLISFDGYCESSIVARMCSDDHVDVVGVRSGGYVAGYALAAELNASVLSTAMRTLNETDIIGIDQPLLACLRRLIGRSWLFVEDLGRCSAIVTRSDLQKTPVRLWLFGTVTVVEMALTDRIRRLHDDASVRASLKPGRLNGAKKVFSQRVQRNEDIDIHECVQFCDKVDLALSLESGWVQLGYSSKNAAETSLKAMEHLRDELAHGNPIPVDGWDRTLDLVEHAERLIESVEHSLQHANEQGAAMGS